MYIVHCTVINHTKNVIMKLLINLMIVLINYFYLLGLSPVLTNYLVSGKYKHTPDKGTMDVFFF